MRPRWQLKASSLTKYLSTQRAKVILKNLSKGVLLRLECIKFCNSQMRSWKILNKNNCKTKWKIKSTKMSYRINFLRKDLALLNILKMSHLISNLKKKNMKVMFQILHKKKQTNFADIMVNSNFSPHFKDKVKNKI